MLGLVMIVRNEAVGIIATLASIKPHIDRWTILDTGSTDGTQDLIRRELADIPGELHEEPFVDFSTTRNRVLELHGTSTSFVIMLSGDDIVVGGGKIRAQVEEESRAWDMATGLMIERRTGGDIYKQMLVIKTGVGWHYTGRTHEVLVGGQGIGTIAGASVARQRDDESKQARWEADLALLALDLVEDPGNSRAAFYLAQSYECLGRMTEALRAYDRRIAMPGWREETYEAMYRRARVMRALGLPWSDVQCAYLEAHAFDFRRAEPLYQIALHYHAEESHALAYLFASNAAAIPMPDTAAFVDVEVYQWRAADLCAIHAYYLPDEVAREQGRRAADRALVARPHDVRLQKNRAFYDLRPDGNAKGLD